MYICEQIPDFLKKSGIWVSYNLILDSHLEDEIVVITIATTIHIFNSKFIVTEQAEAIYFVSIGTNIVEVSMNIAIGIIVGILLEKVIKSPIGNYYRSHDFTTSYEHISIDLTPESGTEDSTFNCGLSIAHIARFESISQRTALVFDCIESNEVIVIGNAIVLVSTIALPPP